MPEDHLNWDPQIDKASGPKYERIVQCLEEDIRSGQLAPGDQLPTQRALAARLGVTVGTVARAYAHAQTRGLLDGEVGRGTFVAGKRAAAERLVDLSLNQPLDRAIRGRLMKRLRDLGVSDAELLLYRRGLSDRDRAAAFRWMEIGAASVNPEQILMTAGAQHGLFLSLAILGRTGKPVLCESMTHPGLKLAAASLGIELAGVPFGEGVDPGDAISRQAKATGATTICLTPIIQNPTTRSWSEDEMRSIANAIDQHQLDLIEDDVYRMLLPDAPEPLWNRVRNAVLVTSISKAITAGLRVGYLAARGEVRDRIEQAIFASMVMIPGLNAEMANRIILDEGVDEVLRAHRSEIAERAALVAEILGGPDSDPHALHTWLRVPERWTATALAERCRREGIVVTPADAFAVGRHQDDHVRISLGGDLSQAVFESALSRIAEVLEGYPTSRTAVI